MAGVSEPESRDPSLLDQLRGVAGKVDPQYVPSANEVPGLLAALIHYTEHGDKLTGADSAGDVQEVLAPGSSPADPAAGGAAPPPQRQPAQLSDDELDRQLADLQAQRDSRRATSQQTTLEHEPGAAEHEPAAHEPAGKGKGKDKS